MENKFDMKCYDIDMEIANYDGFVTPNGFLKVRSSDESDIYPTHSDYAKEYMKREWGMDFDVSLDALKYMTDELGFVQYSNRAFIWERDELDSLWDIYKDAIKDNRFNDSTIRNLYYTCVINNDFYKMTNNNKAKK